ncbi:MAG: DUF1501 domain-containing protein [Lentisphaeria bacterium]|nr:DUF1501 domain-containing protein [Lentisphaeria bacterium]
MKKHFSLKILAAAVLIVSATGLSAAENGDKPVLKKHARSVIEIWVWGGPSQLESFDPKPDAAQDYSGGYKAIPTNVPGISISEFFPEMAKIADKYSIIRSMTHPHNGHETATYHADGTDAGRRYGLSCDRRGDRHVQEQRVPGRHSALRHSDRSQRTLLRSGLPERGIQPPRDRRRSERDPVHGGRDRAARRPDRRRAESPVRTAGTARHLRPGSACDEVVRRGGPGGPQDDRRRCRQGLRSFAGKRGDARTLRTQSAGPVLPHRTPSGGSRSALYHHQCARLGFP